MNETIMIPINKEIIIPSLEKEFQELGFTYTDLIKTAFRLSNQTFHLTHSEQPISGEKFNDEIIFEFRLHCNEPGIPDHLEAMSCKYLRFKYDTSRMEDLVSMRFYKLNKPWPNKDQICSSLLEAAKLHSIREKFITTRAPLEKSTGKRIKGN